MEVCFRVDASARTGAGHVTRCLTLADELSARGAAVTFLCRPDPQIERVASRRRVMLLPPVCATEPVSQRNDAGASLEQLRTKGHAFDWLVVDHYRLAAEWECTMRSVAHHVLVIDDLADRAHDCEVLTDPTFAQDGSRYDGLVPDGCQRLCGADYALLRAEFRVQRQRARASWTFNAHAARVHLFFGSSDTHNHTARFSRLLLEHFPSLTISAVVGAMHVYESDLRCLQADYEKRFRWRSAVENMAEDMAQCEIALGAPGGATWERACLGLPALYLAVSDNQVGIVTDLENAGLCRFLGSAATISDSAFVDGIGAFLANERRLATMRDIGMRAIDGLGAVRVAQAMRELL
jgi:UDP-2,4-diacetamido-2,4,6-trideoxy-beta-L-altropyranose hydrolase